VGVIAWRCFVVEETGDVVISLRRFTWSTDGGCSAHGNWGHDASVVVGSAPARYSDKVDGRRFFDLIHREEWAIDYRWPKACACGREFLETDQWQVNQDPIYRGAGGEEWTQRGLPIGALYQVYWLRPEYVGPDGLSWAVKLPPGGPYDIWNIDSEASGGGRWARSGAAPDLVVTPSIAYGTTYHGFLGSNTAPAPGWLSDPL
jgi:hypothetical protein